MSLTEAFVDLYSVPKLTEARLKRLLERFRTPDAVLKALPEELTAVEGIAPELAQAVTTYRRDKATDRRIQAAGEQRAFTLSWLDDAYPAPLKELSHSPPVLFVRGTLDPKDKLGVAVVGTRRPSHYGQQVAERLARELAESGVTVVSGLARGIDTCAHKAALAAGGRTIAVLGSGIDVCYPPENRKLFDSIPEHGAVLSEFNLGTEPLAMNFPKRNRVVSGLSLVVVAVEAGEKSGVLNTCAWALDQGRPVYAVPGRVSDPTSIGTNRLLREGAKPLTSAADLLRDLGLVQRPAPAPEIKVSDDEKPVLDFLSSEPQHADEICQGLGLPMSKLLGVLAQMELRGLVRQLPGKYFVRAS